MKARISMQLGVAVAFALIFGASRASADFTFDLNVANTSGSPPLSSFTGPYAHVDVALTDSTHATITFTSLTNSGNIYLMGDGGSVAVNVNASSWTVASVTGSNSGSNFQPPNITSGGAGNEDGFGSFNQTFNNDDGFKNSVDFAEIKLVNNSGMWADASNVLTENSDGRLAATHIFVTASPADRFGTSLATGFATNGPLLSAPAPSSIVVALSGVGLFGLIGIAGYRRRTRAILGA